MADYRIYLMNLDGQARTTSTVRCGSDTEALERAKALVAYGEAAEVWQEQKCLGRVNPAPPTMVERGLPAFMCAESLPGR